MGFTPIYCGCIARSGASRIHDCAHRSPVVIARFEILWVGSDVGMSVRPMVERSEKDLLMRHDTAVSRRRLGDVLGLVARSALVDSAFPVRLNDVPITLLETRSSVEAKLIASSMWQVLQIEEHHAIDGGHCS